MPETLLLHSTTETIEKRFTTAEDDPTPIVRLITMALRRSERGGHLPDALEGAVGVVLVRSHDTPQCAAVTFDGQGARVSSADAREAEADATVVVDLHRRFQPMGEVEGNAQLATRLLQALRTPLPPWREAAGAFWDAVRTIPGMPDTLILETSNSVGPTDRETLQLGGGPTSYRICGTPDQLAGVLAGADDLLAALGDGLQVQGTLAQLSVMTAASWRVRFDV